MKMTAGSKPSRADAYALVMDMKTGRRELADYDVDALLRFFAPTLPKRAKTAEQWVAKAAGIKDMRKALRYVLVKQGVAYASNGHRSHAAKTSLEDGFYDPATMLPVDFTESALDIPRTFPSRHGSMPIHSGALELGALSEKKDVTEYVRIPDGVAVNRAYYEDATNGREPEDVFHSDGIGGSKMFGDSEFGQWVIMGLRV